MRVFNPKKILRFNMLVAATLLVASCSSPYKYEKRSNQNANQTVHNKVNHNGLCQSPYIVKSGDALSVIARDCGVGMLELAKINDLLPPYIIYVKQELDLPFTEGQFAQTTASKNKDSKPVELAKPKTSEISKPEVIEPSKPKAFKPAVTNPSETKPKTSIVAKKADKTPLKTTQNTVNKTAKALVRPQPSSKTQAKHKSSKWLWPMHKGLEYKYRRDSAGLSVLEIYGVPGQTVHAVTSGTVVYAGNGIADYGWMIVIKHSGDYMSIYAHNSSLLVEEGDDIEAGEEIALLGATGITPRPKLYLEARQNGRKIDIKKIIKP